MTWKLQGKSRIMNCDEELRRLVFKEPVYVDGKSVTELESKFCFKANVQPLNGRDLLLVPEHQRFIEQYWCFVPSPKTTYDGSEQRFFRNKGVTGEVIERNGINYQVQDIEYWGSYERARIMRVDVGYYANP